MDQVAELPSLKPDTYTTPRVSPNPRGRERLAFINLPWVGLVSPRELKISITRSLAVLGLITTSTIYGHFIQPSIPTPPQPKPPISLTHNPDQTSAEVTSSQLPRLAKFIFGNYSPEQLSRTKEGMAREFKSFLPTPLHEFKREIQTKQWEDLVKQVVADPRLKIDSEDQENWAKLLMMVIYTESGGNAQAKNPSGAEGLAQSKPATAKEAAKKLGITEYNLAKPWDNLILATRELQKQHRIFGDEISLVFAAYNFGQGTLIKALQTYLISNLKLPVAQVMDDFENMGKDGKSDQATIVYIQRYKITLQHLLDSPAVTGKLKSSGLTQEDLDGLYRYLIAGEKLYPEDFNPQTKA